MNYLQKHTLGSIFRGSFGIYFKNFVTLFTIYVIPSIPLIFFQTIGLYSEDVPGLLRVLGVLVAMIGQTIVYFPVTVAISEICLGIRPSVGRAYSRAFEQMGRTLRTYAIAFGIIVLGYIALVIPGMVFAMFYLFVAPVVLLEGQGGYKALQRSRELGRGHYWRNLGVLCVVWIAAGLLSFVVGALAGALMYVIGLDEFPLLSNFVGGVIGLILLPPALVSLVLLYYDMRARKEGYGAAQLAEDLRV
jgi:hypothetical protein